MSELIYCCFLPTVKKDTDLITSLTVRGTLIENSQKFSINFVNSQTNTDNITYQFKIEIPKQKIVGNYKKGGKWNKIETETYLKISPADIEFFLEFVFDYEHSIIRVNRVLDGKEGKGYNHICKYETLFELFKIQSVQIWGDVKKILTFTMKYD